MFTGAYEFTISTLKGAVNNWYDDLIVRAQEMRSKGHISTWNMSQNFNMELLFAHRTPFNDDISKWESTT